MYTPLSTALRRLRQVNLYEFESNLVYRVSKFQASKIYIVKDYLKILWRKFLIPAPGRTQENHAKPD